MSSSFRVPDPMRWESIPGRVPDPMRWESVLSSVSSAEERIPPQGLNVCHDDGLNERRFPRRRGFPYAMVFAYPPPDNPMGSPMIYTGDLGSIRDGLRDGPTHHGFVVNYRSGVRESRPIGKAVVLFGRYAFSFNNRDCSLMLDYVDPRDTSFRRHQMKYLKRGGFYLFFRGTNSEERVLHSWRRLPKTYLRQLQEAECILDEYRL